MPSAAQPQTVSWLTGKNNGGARRLVAYRGTLAGRALRLHYSFDGWQEPARETKLEPVEEGLAVAELTDVDDHLSLECAVTDGAWWDNNAGVDYRLWITFDPLDSHLHVSGRGWGALGVASLRTAMASAGMSRGISSWIDNAALDRVDLATAGLYPLVWIRPYQTSRAEIRKRLRAGAVGLKLHPTLDDYRADDLDLDQYLEIAADTGCPVACHSAPGDADPDHIRRLAERFPAVPIILYHTYLGPREGRRRAARHAREQPNLYLETSWCQWREVFRLVVEVGLERVLFGSDAAIDGPWHYRRQPPNVEAAETYNGGLLSLARALGPESAGKVMGDNARRLFGLKREELARPTA